MKKLNFLIFTLLAFVGCLTVKAIDFEYEGVTYTIISDTEKTVMTKEGKVEMSIIPGHAGLTGELKLSEKVSYNGTEYTLIKIGNYSFMNCSYLSGSLNIPNSVTQIGSRAFYGCSGLTSVTIGNSVTSFGNSAFYSCTGLTSVTIGNSVTEIGDGAFESCSGLTSVTIPNSVTSIGNYAFSNCTGLTEVAVPSSVKEIGDYAFTLCRKLTSIAIGAGIEKVGDNILKGCGNVKDIHVTALEAPKASDNAVSDYSATLWVTPGAENSYYGAVGCWWKFNTVKQLVVPTSFTANRTDFSGNIGDQFRVRGIFEPSDVTLPHVFYTSSDHSVATVDATGLVTILDDQRSCEITIHNLYADPAVNTVLMKVKGALDAIEDVIVDDKPDSGVENDSDILRVYNLQGMRMNVSDREGLRSLPRGIYIVNGKKVLVR